jgi:hypothetical protein
MIERRKFENIEKKYKIELEKKKKEITDLETKIEILNKSIVKKLYSINNNNSAKNKKSINYNQDDSMNINNININQKKNSKNEDICGCSSNISSNITKKKMNFNALNNNINLKTMKNCKQKGINYNVNDNISLYYKFLNKEKISNVRKSVDKNNSAPNLILQNNSNCNNSTYLNKKKFLKNYLNKINNLKKEGKEEKEGKNIYLSNRNDFNYVNKDNSNNDINSAMKNNLKKLPYNFNNTSTIGGEVDNLRIETKKVQQKLSEYHKMIDMRIDELIKDKKYKLVQKQKRFKSSDDFNKILSPKDQLFKKISKISNHGRNKNSCNRLYNTNYRNISNDNTKNSQHKITIYNPLVHKDNTNQNKHKNYNNMKGKIYLDSYNEMMNKKNIY